MENIVLKRPIITEKSMNDAAVGRYTFEVAYYATKNEIRKAVEEQFKVNVVKVKTIKMKGKVRRSGRMRVPTVLKNWKKAVVHLKAEQKIDVFEMKE